MRHEQVDTAQSALAARPAMSDVERSGQGFVVDASILARAFGLPAETVRAMMRDGGITSRCEAGMGEDAGRWRLTFFHAGRTCRLTVDGSGKILKQSTFAAGLRGAGRSP